MKIGNGAVLFHRIKAVFLQPVNRLRGQENERNWSQREKWPSGSWEGQKAAKPVDKD